LAVILLAVFVEVLLPAGGVQAPPRHGSAQQTSLPCPAGRAQGCPIEGAEQALGSLATPVAVDAVVSYPTTAAYDAQTRMLLVGSYADGSIQRLSPPGPTARAATFAWPQDGRESVLRIRIDTERARIWVLGSDRLYLYDSRDSRLLKEIAIGEVSQHSSEHCLPDMALDRSGAVFLSNAMEPALWRVDPVSFRVDRRKVQVDADRDQDFGFSAVAFDEAGTMYAASAISGVLWKVDQTEYTASKVVLSSPIRGACALHAAIETARARTQVLYVAGGFRDTVQRIRLAGHPPFEVTNVATAAPSVVPTDFVQINHDLMVVSSRLSEHPAFNGEGVRQIAFRIVPVRLR
jgi:hypothetical protein